jgi:hypothetical protein
MHPPEHGALNLEWSSELRWQCRVNNHPRVVIGSPISATLAILADEAVVTRIAVVATTTVCSGFAACKSGKTCLRLIFVRRFSEYAEREIERHHQTLWIQPNGSGENLQVSQIRFRPPGLAPSSRQ